MYGSVGSAPRCSPATTLERV
uniref:Uncharacterized protein n=1 Tax=Arundo donax TaxID=35708 RepID=A0A0A9EMJ9_ARUDO